MSGIYGPFAMLNTMRNRILNGDMRIDQANGGALLTVNNTAVFRSVDKWAAFGAAAAGVFTIRQLTTTPPNGFSHYLRLTVTTADAAPTAGREYSLYQSIEGTYCQDLQFGIAASTSSVIISFWVRSSLTGTFSGSIRNGTVNRSYPFTFAINAANTWEYKTISIAVDVSGTWVTTTAAGVNLTFDLGSGATPRGPANAWATANYTGVTGSVALLATNGATLDFTGVQLEPGPVATPFEQRPFPDMLRLCQREFQKTFQVATAPAQNVGNNTGELQWFALRAGGNLEAGFVRLSPEMRATPTVTLFNPAAANAQIRNQSTSVDFTASSSGAGSANSFNIFGTGDAGKGIANNLGVHWTADSRL